MELCQIQGINENVKEGAKDEPSVDNATMRHKSIIDIQNSMSEDKNISNSSISDKMRPDNAPTSNTALNSVPWSPISPSGKSLQENQEQKEQRPWVKENRGWTHEEAKAFKEAVAMRSKHTASLGKRSKLAEAAEANLAGKGNHA